MIVIENLVGALTAFVFGAVIALINYLISRYFIKNRPSLFASAQIIRTLLQLGCIVILFFGGRHTPWDVTYLLVGGCLGLTLPSLYFTRELVRLNDFVNGKEDQNG